MRFETKAVHSGQAPDPATGATIAPIHLTSTFTQAGIGEHKGYEYSRTGNPTRAALERCLADLEEASYGLAFASGMAAEQAVLSLLSPGDTVLAGSDLYGGTRRLLEKVFRPLGITTRYVDGSTPRRFGNFLSKRTRLLWIESPTNPLLRLYDLRTLARWARREGLWLVVDNTFATPYLQRPLSLGAHLVVHSTTKYINGHSDAVGGFVATNDEGTYRRLKFLQNAAGAVPGPFECWLTLRGVKTLAVRMERHARSARRIASKLEGHPAVAEVHYPGLPSHPQHALARTQMKLPGGMLVFRLRGGREAAEAFARRLRVFALAESLGGVESLACHPATMTHASVPKEERERLGVTDDLIRLSVGLEDARDLWSDLRGALSGLQGSRGKKEAVHAAPSAPR